jgi:hypothetical protein
VDHQKTDTRRPEVTRRTSLNGSFQLLAYADDIVLITRGLSDLKEFFIRLERAAKDVGLEVNERKTNYLIVSNLFQMPIESISAMANPRPLKFSNAALLKPLKNAILEQNRLDP